MLFLAGSEKISNLWLDQKVLRQSAKFNDILSFDWKKNYVGIQCYFALRLEPKTTWHWYKQKEKKIGLRRLPWFSRILLLWTTYNHIPKRKNSHGCRRYKCMPKEFVIFQLMDLMFKLFVTHDFVWKCSIDEGPVQNRPLVLEKYPMNGIWQFLI